MARFLSYSQFMIPFTVQNTVEIYKNKNIFHFVLGTF